MSNTEVLKKLNGKTDSDLIAAGFHRLDENLIEQRPPKIQWGRIYQGMTDDEKLQYCEKLACVMNHAAKLIQDERNTLGHMVEQKEHMLIEMKKALDENNSMIQEQMTKFNEDKQRYNKAIAELKAKVRELESDRNN